MNQKVTNYEISKRLDELGFESESHCGWWSRKYADQYLSNIPGQRLIILEDEAYKAYDCWDLLM